jgi:hypothetical protein
MWLNIYGRAQYFPPSLKALYDKEIISVPGIFVCPDRARKTTGEFATDYECMLDLAGLRISEDMVSSEVPLAWDKPGNHDDGIKVVHFDSHVEFYSGKDAYQRLRKEVDAWIAEKGLKKAQ